MRLPRLVLLLTLWAVPAQGQGTSADSGVGDEPTVELPAESRPNLKVTLSPRDGIQVGSLLSVHIEADAREGDDVTVAKQDFVPFELHDKRARVEPASGGRQRFVFDLDLLAFEAGQLELPAVGLRVVTAEGVVGSLQTEPATVKVKSLLANEPNAEPKPPTRPVEVLEDNYTFLYLLGALLGAALIAILTLLVSRWWRRRDRALPPPPPPRPPWEVAVEKLAELRRRKQGMIDKGEGVQFVDEVSDVVRQYLGGRFHFDGLESTTDEMLYELHSRHANEGLTSEVRLYLQRCDLVKFAKVIPDADEVNLIFTKAQDIVQFSSPTTPEPVADLADDPEVQP